jgi:hypothetical protein
MPRRKPCTYGNWSSDVTACAESTTNRGRTEVAGVMSGAGLVRQVFEMPQSGRVLQVGVPAMGAWRWQGSQRPFECLRVVPGTDRPRKQRRAFPILMKLSAGLLHGQETGRHPVKGARWSEQARLGRRSCPGCVVKTYCWSERQVHGGFAAATSMNCDSAIEGI